eukprot:CAMPEP_0198314418 /NCGR_PEP_ID=MMETSP1450-20131203/5054_1 /TAXON_ID=753684 ORGANISM="Madagascaria erythrocladiodes, Strain CCMP3234" /NCGR_SAMPLE_ID=MMETSP1450 /ASSEMBLY_ACC=CAM_ASM_001115 /LENGTH=71 /DNA_ID=CAMNT_0044017463 /DNA_START=19 /DNA_END=231 /DNA_ORIENTATION=+
MTSNMQVIEALAMQILNGSDDPAVITRACRGGISPNAVRLTGWPLLMHAVGCEKPRQAEELIKQGANIDLQ